MTTNSRTLRVGTLGALLFATTTLTAPALAQTAPPLFNQVDANGVDVYNGDFFFSLPEGSIGSGEGALTLVRNWAGAAGWTDNWTGALSIRSVGGGTEVVVEFGTYADSFSLSGGTYTSTKADGATLVDLGGGGFRYTARDGTRIDYATWSPSSYPLSGGRCLGAAPGTCGIPTSIRRPSGMTYTLNYDIEEVCTEQEGGDGQGGYWEYGGNCVSHVGFFRWRGVSNSANYAFQINYATDVPGGVAPVPDWFRRTQVQFTNLDGSPAALPTVTYNQVSGGVLDVTTTGNETWRLTNGWNGRLTGIRRPGAGADTTVISYGGAGNTVASVTREGVSTQYSRFISGSGGSMTVTNANGDETIYGIHLDKQRITFMWESVGRMTSFGYDSSGRLTGVGAPEGNRISQIFDARGNVTQTRATGKPYSGGADIVTSATYPSTCANPVTCNLPTSTTDARGNVTDFTYDSSHGGVLTVTAPAASGGADRAQTRITYAQVTAVTGQPVYLPTEVSTCASGTSPSCLGTANEARTVTAYDTDNLRVTSATQRNGDNSLSATSAFTYDAVGNLLTVDGPLSGSADTTRFRYDGARRAIGTIGPDPDGGGSGLRHRARRLTFTNGLPTRIETGTVDSQSDGDWAAFDPLEEVQTDYDANARPTVQRLASDGTTYALTQTSYDALGRVQCTAQRMNPAEFASLPADACTLDSEGSYGPDRIARTTYDNGGRVALVQTGYGVTGVAADEVTTTYSPNNRVATVTDAEGNRTTYEYDEHDRLRNTRFPSPTTDGVSAPTSGTGADYEQLSYDTGSNVTSRRLRDGQTIAFTYDALDRPTATNMPNTATYPFEPDITYSYDLLGRLLAATDANTNHATFTYDALGRVTSEANLHGTASMQYDAAGRRTRLTYPGSGLYVDYVYNAAGDMTHIRENGATSGIGLLATYAYDDRGRRTALTRGNGTVTTWDYDDVSRLTEIEQNPAGTTHDLTLGFSLNPAGQIASHTRSNDLYAWTGHYAVTRAYTTNGLNRHTAAGPATFSYDANGNLTGDGTRTYTYNAANRLYQGGAAGTLLYYDPLGRLSNVIPSDWSSYRISLYDGDRVIAEDAGWGTIRRRFVFGPGLDEPLVWYEGADLSDRHWLHADERGSIVAVSNDSGAVTQVNRYDEYGVPQGGTLTGRFGYTGQQWIPELGMYYYRARIYSPTLGRFMQTDPIGHGGGMNLYGYVLNDPVNLTDPSGLQCAGCGSGIVVVGSGGGGVSGSASTAAASPGWGRSVRINEDPAILVVGRRRRGGPTISIPPIGGGIPTPHRYERTGTVDEERDCTREEAQDALERFAFPGQRPDEPVGDNPRRDHVIIPGTDIGGGEILAFRLPSGCVRNQTLGNHVFHAGTVTRCLEARGNSWIVRTIGAGTNRSMTLAIVNQLSGPIMFQIVDQQMADYLKRRC